MEVAVLEGVQTPSHVRRLGADDLRTLVEEVRSFLVASVCRTGGHLGSNLGVVELTVALHRVFDSPHHPLVFDTGHQAYVHKLLTGRRELFAELRVADGLSGYPSRAESEHDWVENSHASTALSYADGLAKAFELTGCADRPVVAVIGDGALTGGMAWEALNSIGGSSRPVVVVVNDNGCSYSPTVGALARRLAGSSDGSGYASLVSALGGCPVPAGADAGAGAWFESLGYAYLGPVDGHDLTSLEKTLTQARELRRPVVVHCRTRKGQGYPPAVADCADHLHTVGVVEPATGRPARPGKPTWTDAFADAMVSVGARRPDVVAVTAAMMGPTGLGRFGEHFPDRCYDVGIAEQHAITSAAGLALGGAHPVVALYATFANRAFDQLLLDVGLHRLPVTLVLDRAGVTGPDGPSHHGMWDLPMLATVPGMRVAAPRDAATLVAELDEAIDVSTGPTALRFPKASLGTTVPALDHLDGLDVLRAPEQAQVLLVPVGPMAEVALQAAEELATDGVECTVVDPRWVLPVNPALPELARSHRLVVTVEDGLAEGGVGTRTAAAVARSGSSVPVRCLGLPSEYLPHGSRADLLAVHGLDRAGVVAEVRAGLECERLSPGGLRLVQTERRRAFG